MRKICTSILTLLVLATAAMAAPSAGKVRSSLGEVTRQKGNEPDWSALRVGAKIFHSDKIQTGEESEAVLGFPDGSILTIQEKSVIVLSELLEENGAYKTTVDVKNGRLAFSAQKQGASSSFKFKTGNAVAAIRGTEGIIGGGDHFMAGLRHGDLEITIDGETFHIRDKQTTFKRKGEKAIVMDLSSSGDPKFMKRLNQLLDTDSLDMEALRAKIMHDDSTYQQKIKNAEENVKCQIDMLADTTSENTIVLKGQCSPEVALNLYGENLPASATGEFSLAVSLEGMTEGEKQFELSCTANKVSFNCGTFKTYYKPLIVEETAGNVFNLATQSPVNVCEEGLTIEGSYQTTDPTASIILTIGNSFKSDNLLKVADGTIHAFSNTFQINDVNGLWNEKKATVTFTANGNKQVKSIDLNVSKTCPAVNQIAPVVTFNSYDSLRCVANVSISQIQDDIAIFKASTDGTPGKEAVISKRNEATSIIKLKTGSHEYEFTAIDQAGNSASQTYTLGCYPNKAFTIAIEGKKSSGQGKEAIRVPPAPPTKDLEISKSLRFKIKSPENDPASLYMVTVKQNGKVILQETKSQITSLDYDITVVLNKNGRNDFEIIAVHKSGFTAKATKSYEVR